MTETTKLPTWYWAICITAFIWNLMGLMAFYSQIMMTPEILAQMAQAQQDLYLATPQWVNIAFGIAVIGGTLGCLGLLIRVAWSFYLLALSLVGVCTQMIYLFFMSGSVDAFGPGGVTMPIMIIIIATLLVWFSKKAQSKQWIA